MDEAGHTRATYDAVAGQYAERSSAPWPGLREHLERFASAIGPDGRVIDVGCGPGRDLGLLCAAGLRAVGVDASIGMLRAGPGHAVAQADMRALPVRSGALDGAWSQAALLHVPRDQLATVLGELRRVLRDDGALFVNTATGDGEEWEPVSYRPERHRWFVYHQADDFVRTVTAAGFDIRDVSESVSHRNWINVHAEARPR